jgi:hypothetical protein
MAGFSDYLEGNLLDHVFSIGAGSAYAQPSLYVALSTADPGETGAGLAEPAGNAYARVAFADWARTNNTVSNNSNVTFPEATGNWGTITHFAVMDASTGGNVLMSSTVSPSQSVISGNTMLFKTGNLTVSLD